MTCGNEDGDGDTDGLDIVNPFLLAIERPKVRPRIPKIVFSMMFKSRSGFLGNCSLPKVTYNYNFFD